MNVKGTKKKNQVVTANIFEQQELWKKAEVIKENLTASTWRELETNGKFDKNEKLSFISDDMLILGCDVGSETHYLRAIDTRGRELSKSEFSFSNDSEGFQSAKEWAVKIAAEQDKSQIVLGLEPDRALLVLPCDMDDFKWDQRCSGKSLCCEADKGSGR